MDITTVQEMERRFLKKLKSMGSRLSAEELSAAIESLVQFHKEMAEQKEAEEKAKKEEEKKKRADERKQLQRDYAQAVTSMDLPLDWENAFASSDLTAGVHADSISDGLVLCLNALGRVDIEYIAEITGTSCKEVIGALRGSIYQNPETWNECFYKGWETADEYLSGNMVRKWKIAFEADRRYRGYFRDNVKAIEKVLPAAVNHKDIYVALGTPWLPSKYIDDFIVHLIEGHEGKSYLRRSQRWMTDEQWDNAYLVRHNEETGSWDIPLKSRYSYGSYRYKAGSEYGTKRMDALSIIEKTLNFRPVVVMDDNGTAKTSSGNSKKVINKSETLLAQQKQKAINDEFAKWIWADKSRREELEQIYESRFSSFRARHYDGSFLTFPQMNKDVSLYDYQKNAIARIILSPNTLLAHDVGAGKTYVMIAAGMEMKRMGISGKNLYVVPNNIIGQWKKIFTELYPSANILVVDPKSFTVSKRKEMLCKIRDNDYDGIVMAYSCFDEIGISRAEEEAELGRLLEYLEKSAQKISGDTRAVRARIRSVKKALNDIIVKAVNTGSVCFDELGINTLFVDEAHNYKNIPNDAGFSKSVQGVSSGSSKKCELMLKKAAFVQKTNDGRGVVFATGTPVTNSVTDLYTMQKYLQNGMLALLGIDSFKAWCGMFAQTQEEFEVDVDTSEYRIVTRFSKFHNLPELTSLVAAIADFHSMDASAGIPETDGYSDALIGKTPEFEQYLKDISDRVDLIRAGAVSRTEDNMLKVTVDGRKAALDMRLADDSAAFSYDSKVYRCAENVFDIYAATSSDKSTQLVFCDSSTPKPGFNIYDELTRLLTGMGIPRDEIAYIHDAKTEKAKSSLFAKVRRGDIRILIGSTFRLGLGVNIQDKLIALHHLDVPWRPADMVQREGRILRRGNTNSKVRIFRYITEGSFDAYSWQLLETKQRFICSLLSGSMAERSGSEISDTVLNYGEVKALAVGNPVIKKRFEAANELARYRSLQSKVIEERQALEAELAAIPGKIAECKQNRENALADAAFAAANPFEYSKEERKLIRDKLNSAVSGNILEVRETELMTYRGFGIVLPSNMTAEKPFVWVTGKGRYYVETGTTEIGGLIRIDNRIDSFGDYAAKQSELIASLREKETGIRAELGKETNYADDIERCRALVEKYDRELGVTNK